MSILLQNNMLEAAERKIEESITPANRQNYTKIVTAGMKLAMEQGPDSIIASLRHSKNPISDCAVGAVNLCLLMRKQSRGTMPMQSLVLAASTLMLQALDFADKAGIVKVGRDELVQATHIFTNHLFKQLGITPQMIHTAAGKVHSILQDPEAMQKIQQKAHQTAAGGTNGV